jgi:hypothetical protein
MLIDKPFSRLRQEAAAAVRAAAGDVTGSQFYLL